MREYGQVKRSDFGGRISKFGTGPISLPLISKCSNISDSGYRSVKQGTRRHNHNNYSTLQHQGTKRRREKKAQAPGVVVGAKRNEREHGERSDRYFRPRSDCHVDIWYLWHVPYLSTAGARYSLQRWHVSRCALWAMMVHEVR